MDFDNLEQFRRKKGLDQSSFAQLIGVSKSLISKIENGRRKLTEKLIERIIIIFSLNKREQISLKIGNGIIPGEIVEMMAAGPLLEFYISCFIYKDRIEPEIIEELRGDVRTVCSFLINALESHQNQLAKG
jgi:transcriptional regulator with XRE-family HTH domain